MHETAWFEEMIDISAVHSCVWQKLQLVFCIHSLTLEEWKLRKSLTKASA